MLEVLELREKGEIGKTNILKMDKKVNKAICKILDKSVPKYELTMSDLIKNSEQQLPQPHLYNVRPLGPRSHDPADLTHWKSLPIDVKEHEK